MYVSTHVTNIHINKAGVDKTQLQGRIWYDRAH